MLWKKDLRRFWPLWGTYLLLLFVLGPADLFSQVGESCHGTEIIGAVMVNILFDISGTFTLLVFVVSALSAMAVFSYLYQGRSCNMAASLPISRSGQFFAHYLAGLTWMLGAPLLTGAIMTAAILLSPFSASAIFALQWTVIMVLISFAFYTFACFCAMLTGNVIVLPLVYLVLSVVCPIVEEMIRALCSHLIYGLSSGSTVLVFLSPVIYLIRSTSFDYSAVTGHPVFSDFVYLAFLTAVSAVILLLANLLYRRRKMETAGDVVAIGFLKPVFRYAMAVGCALVAGYLPEYMYDSYLLAPILWVLMLIGAFIGYFGAEMLMQKTFRVFSRWRGYCVVAALSAVLVLLCAIDVFGITDYLPDIPDVRSASVTIGGCGADLEESESLQLLEKAHTLCITQGKPSPDPDVQTYTAYFTYQLKSGRIVSRIYDVPVSDELLQDPSSPACALSDAINCPEGVKDRKDTATEIRAEDIISAVLYSRQGDITVSDNLDAQKAATLYRDGILKDLEEGTIGRVWFWGGMDYQETMADSIELHMLIRGTDWDSTEYTWDYSTYILPDSVHSRECLRKMNLLPPTANQ